MSMGKNGIQSNKLIKWILFCLIISLIILSTGCISYPISSDHPNSNIKNITTQPSTITTSPTITPQQQLINVTSNQITPVPPSSAISNQSIHISSPKDGESVDYRGIISGTSTGVFGSPSYLNVILVPLETGDKWVQPSVSVSNNGKWSLNTYYGNPETKNGTYFQIRAIITDTKLSEGIIKNLPDIIDEDSIQVMRK